MDIEKEKETAMSDIKLFSLALDGVAELTARTASLEKHLQQHVEQNMEVLLGVRFLKTEHPTGKTHKGRIDSLGLDENGCPVIVEYKRHKWPRLGAGVFRLTTLDDLAEVSI